MDGRGEVIDEASAGHEPAWPQGRSELGVPCHPRWVSSIRAFVSGTLQACGWHRSEVEVAALLVGEVATSAASAAGRGRLLVVVEPVAGRARITVHDSTPRSPVPRPAGGTADGGHGLQILETLAETWGTTTGPLGRAVWFEVLPDA